MALWTRVKRLRGGRSHMDSQTCFSKKPRCNSTRKIREKLLSSVSPEHERRETLRASCPTEGTQLGLPLSLLTGKHLHSISVVPSCTAGSLPCLVLWHKGPSRAPGCARHQGRASAGSTVSLQSLAMLLHQPSPTPQGLSTHWQHKPPSPPCHRSPHSPLRASRSPGRSSSCCSAGPGL